jgi:hypothetical protein
VTEHHGQPPVCGPLAQRETEILVLTPTCTCGARAWFNCRCEGRLIAAYAAPSVDGTDVPRPSAIRSVRRLHPTAILVYSEMKGANQP